MIIDPAVHVLTRREEIDPTRLADRVFIVLDVLVATSTIVTALAHGAKAVLPAINAQAARTIASHHAEDDLLLAGEHLADTITGFAPPTPLALLEHAVEDRLVIYSTTNGTVALEALAGAQHVYAAALLNGAQTITHVLRAHPNSRIVLVCSGSMGFFNLEDWIGAGYLVDLIANARGAGVDLSDAARAARSCYRATAPLDGLMQGRVGRLFSGRGLTREIDYASQLSVLDAVVRREGERLVRL